MKTLNFKWLLLSIILSLACTTNAWGASPLSVSGPTKNTYTQDGVTVQGTYASEKYNNTGSQAVFKTNSSSAIFIFSERTNITNITLGVCKYNDNAGNAFNVYVSTGAGYSIPSSGFTATKDGNSLASLTNINVNGQNGTANTISISFSSPVKAIILAKNSYDIRVKEVSVTYDNTITTPTTYFAAHISGANTASIDTNPGGASTTVATNGGDVTIDSKSCPKLNSGGIVINLGTGNTFQVGDQIVFDIAGSGTNKSYGATVQTSGGTDVQAYSGIGTVTNAFITKMFYVVKSGDGIAGTSSAKIVSTSTNGRFYSYAVLRTAAAPSGNTLQYNANGGSGTMANTTGSGSVTLRTNTYTKSGCSFQGWATSQANANAGTVAYADGASYTLSADATLYAVWKLNTPSISCTNNVVTITVPGSSTVYYTTDGSTTPTSSSTAYDPSNKPTIVATTTFKAIAILANHVSSAVATQECVYTTPTYTITNGSPSNGIIAITDGSSAITSAEENDKVYIEATPNTGYSFSSWDVYKTSASGTKVTPAASSASTYFTMPDYAVTVNASFSAINYDVTYSAPTNGNYTISVAGGSATSASKTATIGQTITLAATPSSGYVLSSLTVSKESGGTVTVSNNQFTMPADNVTITATFARVYTVTYSAGASATCKTSDTQASSGENITLATPTWSSHTFLGWYVGDTKIGNAGATYAPTADITVYGAWKEDCAGGSAEIRFLTSKNDSGNNFASMSTSSNTTDYAGDGVAKLIAIGSAPLENSENDKRGFRTEGKLDVIFKLSATSTLTIYVNQNGGTNRSYQLESFSSVKELSSIGTSDYSSGTSIVTSNITLTGDNFTGTSQSGGGSASSGVITISSKGGLKITYSSLAAGYYVFKSTGSSSSYIWGFDLSGGGTCYYVTYDGNGADGGLTCDPTAYAANEDPEVLDNGDGGSAYTKDGYTFTGWNTLANGTGTPYAAGGTITDISDNVTLHAQWTSGTTFTLTASATVINPITEDDMTGAITATITNSPVTGIISGTTTSTSNNTFTVAKASSVEVTAPLTVNGSTEECDDCTYRFDSWENIPASVTADVSNIHAKYNTTYSLSYTLDGGDWADAYSAPTYYVYGTGATLPVAANVEKEGYDFAGWTNNDGGASITEADAAAWGNIAVTAHWTATGYNITYDCDDADSGCPSDQTNKTKLPNPLPSAPVKDGYAFVGWYTNSTKTDAAVAGATIEGDVTLYAKWAALHSVTVTYGSGGSAASPASASVGEGLTTTISATPATGYNFSAWEFTSNTGSATLDNAANNPATLTMGTAAVTINATFGAKDYSVTHTFTNASRSSGGEAGASAATHGTDYSVVVAASSGYVLPSTITVTIGGETATSGTEYSWDKASGTVTVDGDYITGDIVITVSGTADCPSSGSGATVYKFVTKSSGLGTGQVCAAANTDYPQTTSNALSEISGGALIARGTGSLTQLSYNKDCYNFNGTNCWLKMELDCELKSGDIIRYINKNSGSVYIRHTSNTTTTDQITLAGNSKTTIQTIVVPANFATKSTIYMIRASNTSYISYFEIIRPYVVTLNANTNGGKVDGEDTKTMYFVADEAQLLPRATKSDYLFKGWFNASSGGDAVANPYTATTSPKTLYAQFDDCSSKIGTVYKLQVKTELTNGSIAAGDLNEGNYLSAMDGGTAVITGSHAQIVNNNAIDFKDNGDYITVNLDCELKAGDYFKTTISGSKSGIKVTTTGSTTSLQDISYGTNVETEVPASLVGSKTFRIYRQDSNCGGLSYFEIVRPAGSEVTYNNGGHGEAPSSTTAAAVTLADISVTGWKNTGWKADVDVKVSGSTVSAGTEIAVGTVVTILETTTFTAQWVDCCFEFAGGTKDSGWPVAIDGSITTSLYKTSTGAVLTGGTVVNSGTATIGSNDGVKGLVFDAEGNNAITITLSGSHAFGVGTVITISGASGDDNSSSNNFGFSVNGNNLATTSLSTAKASFEKSYTVAASDGVEGGKTIQIKLNTSCLRKTYLKSVTVTGCADCTPIDPELSYSKTTIWMDDATLTATPTLSGYYGTPTISYTSSDPTVVRVDNSSTGAITALKRGTATITATIGETTVSTTDYCGNTADCEITVKDISCGEVVLASATRKSGSGSVMENGTGAYYSASGINSETSGKLGSNGHYMYITLTGTTLQDGDVVVINLNTVGGIGDLAIHLFAGTTSGSTEIGTKASPGTGDNEITLSNVPNNTYSVTMYRTSDNQNHKVDGIKVKRYVCPDSKEFLPTASSGNWNATDNWIGSDGRGASLPTISDRVVVSKPVTVDIEHAVAKSVTIYNNGSDKTGKLTIQPNKGLEVTGLVKKTTDGSSYTFTSEADLILESSSAGNASLVFDNSNNNHATVALYSKASVVDSKWNWQYIGTALSDANALYDYYGSYLYKWSGGWTAVANGADMEAFAGYCIANKTANTTYITEGTLVPTTSHSVDIAAGKDMVLANSWTAPISIASFTNTTFTSTPATVYLFNTGSAVNGSSEGSEAGTYIAVPIASAPYTGNGLIAPQQGFFVTAKGGTAGKITMNYSELVRPAGSHTDIVAGPMKSPVRRDMPFADYDPNVMKIKVSGSVYTDRVIILERADFTEGFDNGWDGERKGMGKVSPSIYVINAEGKKDAVSAIPDYEGTLVGFKAGSGDTEYVMTFNYDGDDILYLNDLKEETSTQISEGNTYTFTTESDDSDARFVISATPFIKTTPTGLDDAEWNGNGVRKVIHNDHMYIIRGGRVFDAVGGLVK